MIVQEYKWNRFILLTEKINFWHLPSIIKDNTGEDGEDWNLSGYREGKFHFVSRWCPPRKSNYFKCCYYLLKVSGIADKIKIE